MKRPWMPLYVSDYIADTGHLRTIEHGAYLLLIMHYWVHGSLPSGDGELARIARMTPPEWKKAKVVIEPLFLDGWKHKRVEFELSETARLSQAGKAGGLASAAARQRRSNGQATESQQPFNDRSTTVQRSFNDHPTIGATIVQRSFNDPPNDSSTIGQRSGNGSSTIGQALKKERKKEEDKKESKLAAAASLVTSTREEAQTEFDQFQQKCHDVLPKDATWRVKTDLNFSPIIACINEGATADDVLAAIKASADRANATGKSVGTWSYFAEAIRDRQKTREAAAATGKASLAKINGSTEWPLDGQRAAAKLWAETGGNMSWPPQWGPPPGYGGCRIDEAVLRENGIDPAKMEPAK